MKTVTLIVGIWFAIALASAIVFSLHRERNKVLFWKDQIATSLVKRFNVNYFTAFSIVDKTYPLETVMYKTELLERTEVLALRIFWNMADKSHWMPHHFNDRQLPEELYFHHTWGGIIVEA